MNNLIIEKLYLFSTENKTAKLIDFSPNRNIITSSQVDGNNKGKSVILKSIYHTLGADCKFDSKWNEKEKTYIIQAKVNEQKIYFYRHDKLFKIMNDKDEKLFETINRMKLAEYLESIFNFAVRLPNKEDNKLEIVPPAYNYLLNYIDQDGMNCTNFSSFNNLAQYSNYKENVLYYHTGVFNEDYYNLIKAIEDLTGKKEEKNKEKKILDGMFERINGDIGNENYNNDLTSLKIEIEKYKNEYSSIINQLSVLKNKMILLRNEREEIILKIKELNNMLKIKDKEIKKSKEDHICPLCNSEIDDNTEISLKKYTEKDDLYILNTELNIEILKINSELNKKENQYKELLKKLAEYENKMKLNSKETNDILKIKGLVEIKDNILKDIQKNNCEIATLEKELKEYAKEKKKYDEQKRKINNKYYEFMYKDKEELNLKEITDKKIENILSVYNVSGSNRPIATIIWYMNLLKLKENFNKDVIKFPLVIDSPQNGELDDTNKSAVLNYIFDNLINEQQLIISVLGYNYKENIMKADNIVYLDNEKYELLNTRDYQDNKHILEKFSKIDNVEI